MKPTTRELATILAALRFWQANYAADAEIEEIFVEHFDGTTPLNADEVNNLCEKLNCSPAGYVVLNLSKPLNAGNGKFDFYVVGEDALSYGKLEAATSQAAELMYEEGHTWESIGIYALLPVPPSETDALVAKALAELETE